MLLLVLLLLQKTLFRITYHVQDCTYERIERILECGMQRSFSLIDQSDIFARSVFWKLSQDTKRVARSHARGKIREVSQLRKLLPCSRHLGAFIVHGSASKTGYPCAVSHLSLFFKIKASSNINHFLTKERHWNIFEKINETCILKEGKQKKKKKGRRPKKFWFISRN